MTRKFTSTIAGASFLITFIGLISKGFGFLREVVYAGSFGIEKEFDVYLVGIVLPFTINSAVFFLAQNYLIPAFQKLKLEDPEKPNFFLKNNLISFFILSLILAFLLLIFSGSIIGTIIDNTESGLFRLARIVLLLSCFTIPLNAIFSVLSAFQQSNYDFTSTTLSMLFPNVLIILSVFILKDILGILSIPVGYLTGVFLQALYLISKSRSHLNISFIRRTNLKMNLGFISKTFVFIVIIETLNQIYVITDRYFFNSVDTGGIAALNYATAVFVLPISIFSFALSTAIFPTFSELAGKKDFSSLAAHLADSLKIIFLIFIPISFIYIFWGESIVELFFQRGKFDSNGTLLTSEVLIIYSFSLLFYSSYAIINKLLYSLGLVKELLLITVFLFGLKVFLNSFLVELFSQNGLALASSICYSLMFTAGTALVFKSIGFKRKRVLFISFSFYVMVNFLVLLIIELSFSLFVDQNTMVQLFKVAIYFILLIITVYSVKPDEIKKIVTSYKYKTSN